MEVTMHDILDWLPRVITIIVCQFVQIIITRIISIKIPKFNSTKVMMCGMWYALLIALVSFDGTFLGTFVMKAVATVAGFCTVSYMVIDGIKEGIAIKMQAGPASLEVCHNKEKKNA